MDKLLFSIIIPIFNVEEYIENCFNSIYNQNIDESIFEIIAINDGSQDSSLNIISNYAKRHTNIYIINKKNEGVSIARNVGIQNAKGKYIIFIDGDDSIIPGSLKKVKQYITKNDYIDILILKSLKSNNEERYQWSNLFQENNLYTGIELFNNKYYRGSVCGCIFNKEFIIKNKIIFPPFIRNSEDTIFFSLCHVYAQRVSFCDVNFYNINLRNNSASRLFQIEKIVNFKHALEYLQAIILSKQTSLNKDQLNVLNYAKYNIISNATIYAIKSSASRKKTMNILEINKFLPININYILWNKTKVKILNSSYRLFFNLVKLKEKLF